MSKETQWSDGAETRIQWFQRWSLVVYYESLNVFMPTRWQSSLFADIVLEWSLIGVLKNKNPHHHSLHAAVNYLQCQEGYVQSLKVTTLALHVVWKKAILLNNQSHLVKQSTVRFQRHIKPLRISVFSCSLS